MAKKIDITNHSRERFKERLGGNKKQLIEASALARKRGLKNDIIPKNPKYKGLHLYLKGNRIYYNGIIYVFGGHQYHQLRTCFPCLDYLIPLAEECLKEARPQNYVTKPVVEEEAKRTNLFCSGCGCHFSVLTKHGEITYIYVGDPKMPETAKAGLAESLDKDFKAYLSGRRVLTTKINYEDIPELNQAIYDRVKLIPYGTTITYGELAKEFNITPTKCSRILNACAVPIAIPTHRVISTRNRLGTYRYDRKLLERHVNLKAAGALKYRLLKMEGAM